MASFERCVADRPAFASVMLANNESGVIQQVAALAPLLRRAGAWLHTDAVQAFGKIGVDFRALGVNAMTLSSHKIHGPIGAGALIVDKRVELEPLIAGGGRSVACARGRKTWPPSWASGVPVNSQFKECRMTPGVFRCCGRGSRLASPAAE